MIHIETLRMRLPSHLRPQADFIAVELASALAASPMDQVGRIQLCEVAPIRVARHATPSEIVHAATRSILNHIEAINS